LALAMATSALAVAFAGACSSDAGTPDAGTPDAGTPDVGTPDVGTPDVASPDGAPPDATPPDGATPDAGTSDDDAACAEGCRLATQVGCGRSEATCVGLCLQDFGTGPCHAEKIALQLCWRAAGLDALECAGDHASLKDGYCEDEKHALTNCLR
jgi:hypothetical protein